MDMADRSLPSGYFRDLYDQSDDPWNISTGWYEQRKRSLTIDVLPRGHFGTVFEPGCSNGELTVLLAPRCDRLLAWDPVPDAVDRTTRRTAALPQVTVQLGGIPDHWPDGLADLVVLSEVGYYLDETDLTRTLDSATASLGTDGVLLAVHWRRDAPDYPLTGDQVHNTIRDRPELTRLAEYQDDDFLLEVFTAGDNRSVAQRCGVV